MSSAFESVSGSVYGVRSVPSSIPSSPHSAPALPSPPTSPNLHGVSPPDSPSSLGSFPSALSAMGSIWSLDEVNVPRRDDELVAFSSQEHPESTHHLVIPSLALGPSLMPTPPPPETDAAYGEALGNVRILVLGGERSLADNLLMRSPQVVHIHGWDQPSGDVVACLEASTILADRERNVRLTVMPPYDPRDNEVGGLIPRISPRPCLFIPPLTFFAIRQQSARCPRSSKHYALHSRHCTTSFILLAPQGLTLLRCLPPTEPRLSRLLCSWCQNVSISRPDQTRVFM
jgi:hypothetical protein